MAVMTGGQALVQQLKLEGIETIFGLPGVQLDWAFDALYDERDHFRVIHTRHEQGAAYMADGFARSSGRIGTFLVVPGPGLLNASAALAPDPELIDRAARLLGQAKRPLIYAGGGILRAAAWTELQELAEMLEAPVLLTPNARGVLSDRHHLAIPDLAAHEVSSDADV